MNNVVRLDTWATRGREPERCLSPNEIGLLLALIRATACALGKPRDMFYGEMLAYTGVDDMRDLERRHLDGLIRYLHDRQLKAIV